MSKLQPSSTIPGATSGSLFTYSGYLVNSTSEPQTWTFSGKVKYRSRLLVNGAVVFTQTNSDRYTGQATLKPGLNPFVFQSASQNESTGPINGTTVHFGGASATETDTAFSKNSAFLIDRCGRDPLSDALMSYANWEKPEDLLADSAFLVAGSRDEALALGLTVTCVKVASATFGADATVDLGGRDFQVTDLTGIPTFANAAGSATDNVITLLGLWTLPSTGSSFTITTDRRVVFGPVAQVAVPDTRALVRTVGDTVTLVSSTQSVTGTPSYLPGSASGEPLWRVRTAADGRSVSLDYDKKGLLVVFR